MMFGAYKNVIEKKTAGVKTKTGTASISQTFDTSQCPLNVSECDGGGRMVHLMNNVHWKWIKKFTGDFVLNIVPLRWIHIQ